MHLLQKYYENKSREAERREADKRIAWYHSDKLFPSSTRNLLRDFGFRINIITGRRSLNEMVESGEIISEDRATRRKNTESWLKFYEGFHEPENTLLEISINEQNFWKAIDPDHLDILMQNSCGVLLNLRNKWIEDLSIERIAEIVIVAKKQFTIDLIPSGFAYLSTDILENDHGLRRRLLLVNKGGVLTLIRIDESNLESTLQEFERLNLTFLVPWMPKNQTEKQIRYARESIKEQ